MLRPLTALALFVPSIRVDIPACGDEQSVASTVPGDDLDDALVRNGAEDVWGRQITVGASVCWKWRYSGLCLQLSYSVPFHPEAPE